MARCNTNVNHHKFLYRKMLLAFTYHPDFLSGRLDHGFLTWLMEMEKKFQYITVLASLSPHWPSWNLMIQTTPMFTSFPISRLRSSNQAYYCRLRCETLALQCNWNIGKTESSLTTIPACFLVNTAHCRMQCHREQGKNYQL